MIFDISEEGYSYWPTLYIWPGHKLEFLHITNTVSQLLFCNCQQYVCEGNVIYARTNTSGNQAAEKFLTRLGVHILDRFQSP